MHMDLLCAVLASPPSTCRGSGGSFAGSSSFFLCRVRRLQQSQSVVMGLKGKEKMGEQNGFGKLKIIVGGHKHFY